MNAGGYQPPSPQWAPDVPDVNVGITVGITVCSQGCSIENTRLVVRYPDRRTQKALSIPLKTSLPATQQSAVAAG